MRCLKCRLAINDQNNERYGLHMKCFTEWFDVPETAEFSSIQRRSDASSEELTGAHSPQNNSFFQGKYKKYSASLNENSYILKMRQVDAPELPEVEYLCNQIGRSLRIPVADFFYIDFNSEKTFVTKNFITRGAPVDLQHIYHFRPDDQHSCEGIIHAVYEKTNQRHDINILIKTILFDSLIGNHDRHGRNLGLIVTARNSALSPIYDNVTYLGIESGSMLKADFNPTGRIRTRDTDKPTMRDYIIEFQRLNFKKITEEFYQSIDMPQLLKTIDNSFCSQEMQSALKKLILKRFKELDDEING